jgi:hypothetical protein
MLQLAYTADIISRLYGLNISLQGCNINILLWEINVNAFLKKKLHVWAPHLEERNFDPSPLTFEFKENKITKRI